MIIICKSGEHNLNWSEARNAEKYTSFVMDLANSMAMLDLEDSAAANLAASLARFSRL